MSSFVSWKSLGKLMCVIVLFFLSSGCSQGNMEEREAEKTIDYYRKDGGRTRVEYYSDDNGNRTVRTQRDSGENAGVVLLKIAGKAILEILTSVAEKK